MKNFQTYFLVFLAFFFACKKESQKSPVIFNFTPSQGSVGTLVYIHGLRFDSVTDHITVSFNGVTTTPTFVNGDSLIAAAAPAGISTGKIMVTVNGRSTTSSDDFVFLPDNWTSLAKLPANLGRSYGVGFSIGNKGYFGMGNDLTNANDDLYEYDPSTNSWTQKSSMGKNLQLGMSFVINGKAYVGIGKTDFPDFTNSFYEYDPALDKWTQKADFPGEERYLPVGLAIGNKGYVGLGGYGENDWWEYDPASNTWTRKADLAFSMVPQNPVGFAISDKGYVIGSFVTGPVSFEGGVIEYNPSTDTWVRKKNFPGGAISDMIGVGTNDKGFLIGYGGFWIYDPSSDLWQEKGLNSPHGGISGFFINNKLYYESGLDLSVYAP